MKNGTFCEILLKCKEKREMWYMPYFMEFYVDSMSFYPMQFFEYFFNIENYSKDFYPYHFFHYFFKHQYDDFFPYSDFEYFYRDEVHNQYFNYYDYKPYEFFDYFFYNQSRHFPSYEFDFFSYHESKPNETFCNHCVNTPDTKFQEWLQSIDLKRFTEVGVETICGKQNQNKECVLMITQIAINLKEALEKSVSKDTICYTMFRCPRDVQPVINQEFHFFSDSFKFRPEGNKCAVCHTMSDVFQSGIKSMKFHRYIVAEFENTYCNKIFSKKAQCERFLNYELGNLMKKIVSAIEKRQLCKWSCDDWRNIKIESEFYEYFLNSNDKSCHVCKIVSQLLKKLINSKSFENAVYHSFEVEKCKTIFPGKSECAAFLEKNYFKTVANMSQGLGENAICKSSCKEERNNLMYFSFDSYHEKPQNNCVVCQDLIGELISYKPDNTNIESIMENLCFLWPSKKAEYCTGLITQYKNQIKELVFAHKTKQEVCETINQCSPSSEYFDFFKSFYQYW